jgi:lipoprotein-releasing system ATP-binding protein
MSDTRQLKSEAAARGDGKGPHFVAQSARDAAEPARSDAKPSVQIAAIDLWKRYHKGRVEIPVLRGVNLQVRRGEFVSIVGQSGSGKSTLLHLLATLDAPDQGEIHFGGDRIDNVSVSRRDQLRNQKLGMIFQFYHLLPELTALENVMAPMLIAQGVLGYFRRRREYVDRAKHLLDLVGLLHRTSHRPRELSGGEMQRTAIARALVAGPEVLLADEPTGNLDSGTGEEILRTLRTLNHTQNLTIVMVTHDRAIAAQADRTVRLAHGQVEVA